MLLGACRHWKQWGQHPAKCLSQRWAGSTCLAWSGLSGMREMIWSRDPCSSTSLHGAFSSMKHSLETDVAWDGCYICSESGKSHCKVQSGVGMSDVSFVSGRTLRESSPAWDHPGVQITPMDNGPSNCAETKTSATFCQAYWKRKHMPGSQRMWFGIWNAKGEVHPTMIYHATSVLLELLFGRQSLTEPPMQ